MASRFSVFLSILVCSPCIAQEVVLTSDMHHLRHGSPREWSDFPENPESDHLQLNFLLSETGSQWTLSLRQQDVRQDWRIHLNGRELARLPVDENDMQVAFPVPSSMLVKGKNTLTVQARSSRGSDDIRVGQIRLVARATQDVLGEATLVVIVRDETEQPVATPCRLTIVNEAGTLIQTGARSNDHLAVRPGTVYTSTGKAVIPVPAGTYTIFAGRGFEYSLAKESVGLQVGDRRQLHLAIRREVPTGGYVACDTHVHTRTHSGHGDSTVQERMITLAGEGIELPIATDHNVHVDHSPFAVEMNVSRFFTPVIGNEVTTKTAHFNIFPVVAGSPPPDHRSSDWSETFARIDRVPGAKVVILNHARDIHSGVRPFGPKLFNDAVGVNIDGWKLRANAMEVLNSSATQTDIMQLFHDWMTLLNRGHRMTPIGSSDSHDVARHFVGQGRTYIRCDDSEPGMINVDEAVSSLLQGQVRVSYGLLTELTVEGKYTSGELARISRDFIEVDARVLAPHWIDASKILLFANGEVVREEMITPLRTEDSVAGVKWQGSWNLPRPRHDIHLVAVALGPGIDGSYWKTAKPYQPARTDWDPHVLGCSGALWIDADGDGRPTAAFDYARQIIADEQGDVAAVLKRLADYDSAIAAQCAEILQTSGRMLISPGIQQQVRSSSPVVRNGFEKYVTAWRRNQVARAE